MDGPLMPLQDPEFYAKSYAQSITTPMLVVLCVVHREATWDAAGAWTCRLQYQDFGLPDRSARRALAALEDMGLLAHRRCDHCIEITMRPLASQDRDDSAVLAGYVRMLREDWPDSYLESETVDRLMKLWADSGLTFVTWFVLVRDAERATRAAPVDNPWGYFLGTIRKKLYQKKRVAGQAWPDNKRRTPTL